MWPLVPAVECKPSDETGLDYEERHAFGNEKVAPSSVSTIEVKRDFVLPHIEFQAACRISILIPKQSIGFDILDPRGNSPIKGQPDALN